MAILVLICLFLILTLVGTILAVVGLRGAPEATEDMQGFHFVGHGPTRGTFPQHPRRP